MNGIFGDNHGCGCGNNYSHNNCCNENNGCGCGNGCGCKFNLGGTSSCKILIYLVVLYVLFNCGIFNCGLDICTLLILLMFICCFCKGKTCCR